MQESLLKDETLAHKLISKGSWMYLFALLGLPLGYAIRVIISNDLSVGEVGIIYGLISLMGLISILSSLGLNQQALVYFLPKYYLEHNKDYVTTIYKTVQYINIFMTLLVSVCMIFFIEYLGSSYIDYPGIEAILYIFLVFFVFTNLSHPLKGVYQAFQNVFTLKFSEFIKQSIITLCVAAIFIFSVGSVFLYSVAFVIGNIVFLLLLYYFYTKKYASEIHVGNFVRERSLFTKLIHFGLHGLIAANAMMIIHNIDMQMLLILSDTENAGYYTNYMSLIGIATLLLTPIISLLFPIISELYSKGNTEKLGLLQDFFYKYILIFTLSVVVLLGVFGEVLGVVLYGQDFLYSGTLLQYLAVFGIFKVIFAINFAILMGIGHIKKRTNILIGVLILNIVLNIILIPLYGALGAGLATGISWTLMALASFYYVYQHLPIHFDWVFYIKNTCIIGVLGVIYSLFHTDIFVLENTYRYTNLAYLLVLGFVTYLILSLCNLKEIKNIFRELKRFRK
ncbi:flippase [Candidatus Gracilibacteria bacterium]|nr:flippase [Candidatus Gracilibacteria bacterium]